MDNKTDKRKEIDFLVEDPEIPGQRFALLSIVGPNMSQKCDVWGIKIKGVTNTIEQAKAMCKRLLKFDDNYDIYTVEVGKFFPLEVEPNQIEDIEYQDDRLNTLMKSYLENKENANEQFRTRTEQMKADAIREGKSQKEIGEHPIAVLQRKTTVLQDIEKTEKLLSDLRDTLSKTNEKIENFTEQEKDLLPKDLDIDNVVNVDNVDITEEIKKDLENKNIETSEIDSIIKKIKDLEQKGENTES